MAGINIFFLHGFLGLPDDWQGTFQAMGLPESFKVHAVDYFKNPALDPHIPLSQWGRRFNELVRAKSAGKNILVGYSLGGRLGLQALEQNSSLWFKSVFISTNPGFPDALAGFDENSPERAKRWMNDAYWAEKFSSAEWQSLIKTWNGQPIFGERSNEPPRDEKKYSREVLSLALTTWSLAQQKNMRSTLEQNARKISWVVGAEDEKFMKMSDGLKATVDDLHTYAIEGAAHRILFDQPERLGRLLREIITG